MIDLAIASSVDDSSGLSCRRTLGSTGEATSLVSVLDRFDIAEVTGKPVQL